MASLSVRRSRHLLGPATVETHPDGYVECLPEGDEPVAFVSDEYNDDLLMGETFGMTSVRVQNDEEAPYRESDVRVSTLADVPDVFSTNRSTPFE